jgi:hypothetical protein
MIGVIGVKRILILVILIALNAGLGAAAYLYVMPENQRLEGTLNSTRAQISTKRAEAQSLREDFQQIEAQRERFEALQDAGFLSDQNRLVARRRIISIQQYTKVLSAAYDIKSAEIEENVFAEEIGYAVLDSPVDIRVEAIDDVDFYNFIYWMENAFPGHISIETMRIRRDLDVNDNTLRSIGTGNPVALINGDVEFSWRTIVPEENVRELNELNAQGF